MTVEWAYSGDYQLKGATTPVGLTDAWAWPLARLLDVHDGDTVKLAIDHGFGEDAKEWIRLKDVRAPELDEPGGPEATDVCQSWFDEHAPDGYVQVTTFRTSAPLEIRFRASFSRYIGIIVADGNSLNEWLRERGYTDQGM